MFPPAVGIKREAAVGAVPPTAWAAAERTEGAFTAGGETGPVSACGGPLLFVKRGPVRHLELQQMTVEQVGVRQEQAGQRAAVEPDGGDVTILR